MAYDDFGTNMDNNPYSAGEAPEPARPKEKPTSVTVFGILNLVFGALGICGMIGALVSLFGQPGGQPNPVTEIMENSPGYRMFMMVSMGLGAIFTIVLIIAGIGLLSGNRSGRSLSIVYAVYGIISCIVGLIANFVWVFGPLMERLDQLPAGPERAGAMGGIVGGTVGGCFGLIYPVLLLIFMKTKKVTEYFQE